MPPAPPAVAPGLIRLIIAEVPAGLVYMDIPLKRITANVTKPRAYLLFLGAYCTGDMSGFVARDVRPFVDVGREGPVDDGATYRFVVPGLLNPLGNASIDLEVLARNTTAATTTETGERFRDKLLPRDPRCVFTDWPGDLCMGQHLIPFARGTELFQFILDHRPKEDEDCFSGPDTIDSVKNGLNVVPNVHAAFRKNAIAFMKTPNPFLQPDDIPPSPARELSDDVAYPLPSRYTVQWLDQPPPAALRALPHNVDAAFSKTSDFSKPAAALLHYTYAGAAMLRWGRTNQLLRDDHIRRRPLPTLVEHGVADRKRALEKRDPLRDPESGKNPPVLEEDEEPANAFTLVTGDYGPLGTGGRPDAYQLMAMFASNSPAARARRDERRASVSSWVQSVPDPRSAPFPENNSPR